MTYSPKFLRAIVDTLLPGLTATETQAALPPASQVDVDKQLTAHLKSHQDKTLFLQALAAIADEAGGEMAFVAKAESEQTAVLQQVEQTHNNAFNALLFIVSADYYESETVLRAFGWRITPPQPLGYPLPPFDEGLLALVKKKQPLWRPT